MMTQELRAGILTAPLAAIDRRALSQAWYSALGLARSAPAYADPVETKAGTGTPRPPATAGAPAARTLAPIDSARRRGRDPSGSSATRCDAAGTERRAAPQPLARAIERTLLRQGARFARATFFTGAGRTRVHVVLQSRGADVRLIAICAPGDRSTVARALAQARFALAARGIALRVEQRSPLSCS